MYRINFLLKNILSVLLSGVFISQFPLHAQNTNQGSDKPGIFYREREHDFGELQESMNFATHRFEFVNRTPKPIIVNRVESSCGCTAPSWSSDPVEPGQKGYIEARYETTNRLGKFDKTLTVYTNSPFSPISYLAIKGNVVRNEPKQIPNNYVPPKVGRLDFDKYQIAFEPLLDNQTAMKEVRIINQSDFTTQLYLVAQERIPAYAKVVFPSSLEPNEVGKIQISIDGKLAPGYGFGGFELAFQSNAPGSILVPMQVNYVRSQYFPELTKKQLKKAPKMLVEPPIYDFGKQERSGGFIFGKFTLKNTGKKPLEIKQINPDCPCIAIEEFDKILAPGKSVEMKFKFDTVTKTGAKSIGIRMVTNDPSNPERYIWVKAQFPEKYEYKCPTCP